MRDLFSPSWVIPRFLGKRVIKGKLSFLGEEKKGSLEAISVLRTTVS